MLHTALFVAVAVDPGDLLHGAGVQVPGVEVAALGGEEDARGGGVEGCGVERIVWDVERGDDRVLRWWGGEMEEGYEGGGA